VDYLKLGDCASAQPLTVRGKFLYMKQVSRNGPKLDPQFTNWRLRIEPSRIHRLGVFAAEDISRGRKVIEYTGERISRRTARKRFLRIWRSARPKRYYLFELDRRWVVDGAVGGSGAELINHSCDPNLRTRRIRGHILYFSRREIPRGEELTVDYRFSERAVRVRCRCGSPKCRGSINRA
jgi:SET domain-containing protein